MRDKDFLTTICDCVFYLLGSFTDNLCTIYVLKTQELELHENCCDRKKPNKPYILFSIDSVEKESVSDTDDEGERSVVVDDEDQNVCIT